MTSMNKLNRLLSLREQEVDRLQAEFAAKNAVRRRYQDALQRLDHLFASSGPSGALPPALALNCGEYKESVLQLSAQHRRTMEQHEAEVRTAGLALRQASQRQQALGQVADRQRAALQLIGARQEQKRQDDTATQVWLSKDVR